MKNRKVRAGWKTILFFLVTAVVVVRIVYILALGKLERKYEISAPVDLTETTEVLCENLVQEFRTAETRLHTLELLLSNIAPDRDGEVEVSVRDGDMLLYQTNVSLDQCTGGEWHSVYMNIPVVPEKTYQLTFHAQNCGQSPNMLMVEDAHAAPESRLFTAEGVPLNGQAALQFGYMRPPSLSDRMVSSALWLLGLLLFTWFLSVSGSVAGWLRERMEKLLLSDRADILFPAGELFLCLMIVHSGGVSLQESTRIALYLLSVCCAWKFPEKQKEIRQCLDHFWKKICLCLMYGYGAFALVGQRLFLCPLDLPITVQSLFVYAVAVVWMIPVIHTMICGILHMSRRCVAVRNGTRQMHTALFVLLMLCFLLLPAALNLYGNNPGISTWDTRDALVTNARHLHGMYDWHPAFYCMLLRAIITVWDSTYAVIFVQYFFWAYVMGEGLLYFRKLNVNERLLLAVALFSGANAGNFLHLNTIWKDIPYTLSLLWTVIILAKLSLDDQEYQKKWYVYVELLIALVGLYFYRKNGVVSFFVIAVAAAAVLRRSRKVLGTLALSVLAIVLIRGPLYAHFEVVFSGRSGMYIGLGQDILGVYYTNGEISGETLQMVNVMTSYDNAEYDYNPTWSRQSYDLDVEPGIFIRNYVHTFINNPVIMTKAVIDRMDALWDIFQGQEAILGCVNGFGTLDGQENWNDYYPPRTYNSVYPWMARFTTYTASSQWISALLWRSGIWTLLSLTALAVMVFARGKQKYLLLYAPPAGHILGLLLSTGWADFRYYWPVNLISLFLLLTALVALRQKEPGQRKEERDTFQASRNAGNLGMHRVRR